MRLIDGDALIKAIIRKEPFNDCARVVIAECVEEVRHAPTVEPEPKWIPVRERLPEDEQFVLVTYKTTDRIHVCQYHEDGSRNQWYSLNDMCRAHNNVVLAWMPLPEPYREEGD